MTEAREPLSIPALGTVVGSGAAAVEASRLPSLRVFSSEASRSERGQGRPPGGASLHASTRWEPAVRLQQTEPLSGLQASSETRTRVETSRAALPAPAAEPVPPLGAQPGRSLSSAPAPPSGSTSNAAEPMAWRSEGVLAVSISATANADSRSDAAPPHAPAPQPRDLFRAAALEARQGLTPSLADAAEPKLGAWGALALLLSLVAALFCGAGLLSVEVTVRAPGALRAPNGLRSVESILSGAVTEVLVQAGDEVTADQVVARLEETQLRATLTLRERELATLRHDTDEANLADRSLLQQTANAVQHQRSALARRSSIHRDQLRSRSAQLENVRVMREHGVASGTDELSGEESVQAAAESIALVGSQLAELNLSLADRKREWKQRELERNTSLSRAVAAVEEAKSLLALTEVRSPASGRVESLLVTPGAVVQPGRVIAQIVPKDAPRSIVAFLPSREMAFVSVGSQANVEVESLPVNEFGMARARVKRISTDIAKPEEMATAFGEAMAGSFVRVELELVEDANQGKMAPHLRSGERVLVRLHRREQRVLGLIFEFTRKWLGW